MKIKKGTSGGRNANKKRGKEPVCIQKKKKAEGSNFMLTKNKKKALSF